VDVVVALDDEGEPALFTRYGSDRPLDTVERVLGVPLYEGLDECSLSCSGRPNDGTDVVPPVFGPLWMGTWSFFPLTCSSLV